MKDVNKWFAMQKSEFTPENAKEFFYAFECNPNYMDTLLKVWWELNVPQEKIISWTSEYYEKDIMNFESLDLLRKCSYMYNLSGILNQFNEALIVDISKRYIKLLDIPKVYQLHRRSTFNIAKSFISYFKGGNKSYKDGTITKEKLNGYLPALSEINQMGLLTEMLDKMVHMIIDYPKEFSGSGSFSRAYYYDILMEFNNKYNLNYESKIDHIKPDVFYTGIYL